VQESARSCALGELDLGTRWPANRETDRRAAGLAGRGPGTSGRWAGPRHRATASASSCAPRESSRRAAEGRGGRGHDRAGLRSAAPARGGGERETRRRPRSAPPFKIARTGVPTGQAAVIRTRVISSPCLERTFFSMSGPFHPGRDIETRSAGNSARPPSTGPRMSTMASRRDERHATGPTGAGADAVARPGAQDRVHPRRTAAPPHNPDPRSAPCLQAGTRTRRGSSGRRVRCSRFPADRRHVCAAAARRPREQRVAHQRHPRPSPHRRVPLRASSIVTSAPTRQTCPRPPGDGRATAGEWMSTSRSGSRHRRPSRTRFELGRAACEVLGPEARALTSATTPRPAHICRRGCTQNGRIAAGGPSADPRRGCSDTAPAATQVCRLM